MSVFIEVHLTTETELEAEKIAEMLLVKRLAACVQISGPIKSVYTWQGKRENATEWFCCVKSELSLFSHLVESVRELHSYQCPQITAVPIVLGNDDYLNWLRESITTSPGPGTDDR